MAHSIKLVLLGGSFDPIHNGHMAVAHSAVEAGYDQVIFLPVALSPHKLDRPPAPALDRWAMCVLATLQEPRFRVSRHELEQAPPSYSADTVHQFRRQWPQARMSWAIGADNLKALHTWMRVDDFVQEARFLVVPRDNLQGRALDEAITALPPWLRAAIDVLDMPPVPVSSTAVRDLLHEGADVTNLIPPEVALFISRYGVYAGSPVVG